MNEPNDAHHVGVTPERLLRGPLTARRAAHIIVWLTVLVTIAGGVAIWLLDHREFPDLGESLWWSLQTVTTVGYGDIVPEQTGGRIIAAVVMLQGIALITVVAASVTAALIEQARKRRPDVDDEGAGERLARIEERLGAIETALSTREDGRSSSPRGGRSEE